MWFRKKTKEEKLIDIEAKIKAWEAVWLNVDGTVPGYRLSEYQNMLYQRNKLNGNS